MACKCDRQELLFMPLTAQRQFSRSPSTSKVIRYWLLIEAQQQGINIQLIMLVLNALVSPLRCVSEGIFFFVNSSVPGEPEMKDDRQGILTQTDTDFSSVMTSTSLSLQGSRLQQPKLLGPETTLVLASTEVVNQLLPNKSLLDPQIASMLQDLKPETSATYASGHNVQSSQKAFMPVTSHAGIF